MSLTSGTRLGAYEVIGLIGSGGQGESDRVRAPALELVEVSTLADRVAAGPHSTVRHL